jgi:hypothetical protein
MNVRSTLRRSAALVAFATTLAGTPAHAAGVGRDVAVLVEVTATAYDVATGTGTTTTTEVPAGQPWYLGDPVPPGLGDVVTVDGASTTCRPGERELVVTQTTRNAFGEVLYRFHLDLEFYYDCAVVTRVVYLLPYGSDYAFFWRYAGTTAQGVGKEGRPVVVAYAVGEFEQCLSDGYVTTCPQHATRQIVVHLYGNGDWVASGN